MDTMKDTKMQPATDAVIEELRMLVQDFKLAGSPMIVQTAQMSKLLDRMEKMQAALRQHHNLAMCEGCDHSHPLTQLRLSAYQQSKLYADTVSVLESLK